MKIKTFHAKSFREALAQVKKEMGEDAVILSTEEKKGLPPSVRVEAAVDYDAAEAPPLRRLVFPAAEDAPVPPAAAEPLPASGEIVDLRRALTEVRAEVGTIREYLETARAEAADATMSPGRRDVLRFLRGRGVREEHARTLCGKADSLKEIPRAMLDGVRVREGGPESGKVVMLIGPTGVGKTTTVAKLAAEATRVGKRAAVVSLDSYRIGAIEQIRIYAKLMGIPLEIAPDAGRVKACVARHSDKDVVFIDTTGRNPMGGKFLSELSPIYEAGVPVETHLLISATCDYDFLEQAWKAYSRLPVDCVGITKVDEAVRYGALYNVAALCGKPIAYLTTGQTVPGDISFPSRRKVLEMVLTENPAEPELAACAQA
ncbi:MAG: flagellar biosynthesis protein FlhF [Thermodesulfobacteriota bacterium]